jgi:hypothetical protein
MRNLIPLVMLAALLLAFGCGPAAKPVANNSPAAPVPPTPPGAPKPPTPPGPNDVAPAPPATPMPAATPMPPADPPLDPSARPAAVGAGAKGQYKSSNPVTDIIAVPISARFRAEERLTFEAQIPKSMQIYKALDPQGKGPKTHAEFMEKIIQQNQIKLPQLPAGDEYQYDPATEQLMVVTRK